MECLVPHTLVKAVSVQALISEKSIPQWANDMLKRSTYVIVRRGSQAEHIPVGIRGFQKNQRFAAWLKPKDIITVVSPKQVLNKFKALPKNRSALPTFQTLGRIQPLLTEFEWGVGGSLEYELATGISMVNQKSDIDVIMNLPKRQLNQAIAAQLVESLNQTKVHVDVQVVKGQAGFSLEEFATHTTPAILVKTENGPQLVNNPWEFLSNQEG